MREMEYTTMIDPIQRAYGTVRGRALIDNQIFPDLKKCPEKVAQTPRQIIYVILVSEIQENVILASQSEKIL